MGRLKWIPLVLIAAATGFLLSRLTPSDSGQPAPPPILVATSLIVPPHHTSIKTSTAPPEPGVRRMLVWKLEDGPDNAPPGGDPHDVGPAWIDTFKGNRHVGTEKVNGGEWITRAEAKRIAHTNGYELWLDD